jgi:hypothetical protein
VSGERQRPNGHAERVRYALYRGEANSRLLDGRDFDARYWQRSRAALANMTRQLEQAERERDALRAVVDGAA